MPRLALMTISLLRETYDHPDTKGFLDRAESTFAAAEASPGFIARSRFPAPGDEQTWGEWVVPAIFLSEDYVNRAPPTLSLWRDLESAFAFAYNGLHAEALSKRREWFVHPESPGYVIWWVGDDHTPNWAEACARYDKLQQAGASPDAFDFKHSFSPEGQPIKIDRAASRKRLDTKQEKP